MTVRISAFADCDSESAVIRVPYKLLADMVKNCPPSDDLSELKEWLMRLHNAKLIKLLKKEDIQ